MIEKDFENDILQELSSEKLDYLYNEIMVKELPAAIHVYNLLGSLREWVREGDEAGIKLLGVGNSVEDGTFVSLLYLESGSVAVAVYALEGKESRLLAALAQTQRIPWTRRPLFEAVLERLMDPLQTALTQAGLELSVYAVSGTYWMDRTLAAALQPPSREDVKVKPLTKEDLENIYPNWAHRDVYSLGELVRTLEHHMGAAIWLDGTLVAWCLEAHYGGLGLLQTAEGFTRRGFGSLAAVLVAGHIGAKGRNPHANVMDSNLRSRALFEKLGFSRVASIRFLTALPK